MKVAKMNWQIVGFWLNVKGVVVEWEGLVQELEAGMNKVEYIERGHDVS